ncbi:MAG: efflux RND transporter periplasmic adaptor subunit [Thermodesulfobacteriota bacterium]
MTEEEKGLAAEDPKKVRALAQIAAVVVILAVGAGGAAFFIARKPEQVKAKPPVSLPVVKVHEVREASLTVTVDGEGTVKPLAQIQVSPQVSGKVTSIAPGLMNGGSFRKGEVLLEIDSRDYELAEVLAQAKVKDAESTLLLQQEESEAAKQEWIENREDGQPEEPPPLVARIPQLTAARAALAARQADLTKARLDLSRTKILAPFDGRVASENVDAGQIVSPGQVLAVIYATDAAEISVPLVASELSWIKVPGFTDEGVQGSPAKVTVSLAGREHVWDGRVVRAEGKVDEATRLVNVVVRVDDPFSRVPPLAPGLFASVAITGTELDSGVIIPTAALHDNDVVYVVDANGVLSFRPVKVGRVSERGTLVREGLSGGELIVISPLKSVTNGMRVRIALLGENGAPAPKASKENS